MSTDYQAIVIVHFGGPEKMDDVIPFLENVLRGRNVPRERLEEVAEHYRLFDGKSPINDQVRELIGELQEELQRRQIDLPVYWGNRNWYPFLEETVTQMADDGIQSALAIVLSAYSSYSGCRQYREDIERARAAVGERAPAIDKLRVFYNHPGFIAANTARVRESVEELAAAERDHFQLVFTAHSLPCSMAASCDYVEQLQETCRLVAEELELPANRWDLVYQSRSGRPSDPWLEPDILDFLPTLSQRGRTHVVIMPIGFLSDHMEVVFDLDTEARDCCAELGLTMLRASTVGTHPLFVEMLGELIMERLDENTVRRSLGQFGPRSDVCAADCCPAAAGRPMKKRDDSVNN